MPARYAPDLEYCRRKRSWRSSMSLVNYGTSRPNCPEDCVNLNSNLRSSEQTLKSRCHPMGLCDAVVHGAACRVWGRSGIGLVLPGADADCALQVEPEPPSPYSAPAPQGDQLAGLRGRLAAAREPDALVHRGSNRRLGG